MHDNLEVKIDACSLEKYLWSAGKLPPGRRLSGVAVERNQEDFTLFFETEVRDLGAIREVHSWRKEEYDTPYLVKIKLRGISRYYTCETPEEVGKILSWSNFGPYEVTSPQGKDVNEWIPF